MTLYQELAEYSTRFWPMLADHLWQATLFFLVVLLLTILLRRGPARVRYVFWLLAGAKLALPAGLFVILVERGGMDISYFSKTIIPSEPVITQSVRVFSRVTQQAVQLAHPVASLGSSTEGNTGIYLALTGIWWLGFAGLMGRWWRHRRQVLRAIRAGKEPAVGREAEILGRVRSNLEMKREIRLIVLNEDLEPGVWGIWRPRIVLQENLASHLSDAELETIMTHELVHVKRWDNLVSQLQMLFCGLFWFYPVVWIIDRKLLAEREQACDEEVLRLGRSPDHYASGLWKVLRFCLGRGIAGVSQAAGSNLKRRVKNIMSGNVQFKLKQWQRMLLAGSAVAMILSTLAAGQFSQGRGGRLWGSVYDASGAAIPGARVIVSNLETGNKEIVYANNAGEYEFTSLPEGTYEMEVTEIPDGFKLFQRKDVVIRANAQQQLNPVLEVGEVFQTIEVTAKAPQVSKLSSSGVGTPRRIRVGGNVQQANLISETKPVYPEKAQQSGIEGTVLLEAVITKQGTVGTIRALNTLTHPELVTAAMEAVKQWLYQPTLLNGEPIEVVTTVAVNFRLAQTE
jgi:TonB family protein